MLVVQIVTIWWTKALRDAEGAVLRRDLPRAFPIDDPTDGFLLQHLRLEDRSSFAPKLIKREMRPTPPACLDELRIARSGDGAYTFGLTGTTGGGMPRRHPIPELVVVEPGSWARITVNARHTSYSGQHYSETTYNVAVASRGSATAIDLFQSTAPARDKDLRAHLF